MTTPTLLSPPTDIDSMVATAHALFASDKGLLAIDESISTCNKRFAPLGITQDEPTRRAYRELIVTTPGLGECISGAILYDETIRQRTGGGVPFLHVLAQAGILAGIKVDLGTKPMPGCPGEKLTHGLDGLPGRLSQYPGWEPASLNGGRLHHRRFHAESSLPAGERRRARPLRLLVPAGGSGAHRGAGGVDGR